MDNVEDEVHRTDGTDETNRRAVKRHMAHDGAGERGSVEEFHIGYMAANRTGRTSRTGREPRDGKWQMAESETCGQGKVPKMVSEV